MQPLQNIIHLYLGAETTQGKLVEILRFDRYTTFKNHEYFEHKLSQIKLILRSTDKITIGEMNDIKRIEKENEMEDKSTEYANVTAYLLSKGFDLFNLIQTGQAIEKL